MKALFSPFASTRKDRTVSPAAKQNLFISHSHNVILRIEPLVYGIHIVEH